jgi:hypothetical protein
MADLSCIIAADPRQRSYFLVSNLWDSWPYFYCLSFETSLYVALYYCIARLRWRYSTPSPHGIDLVTAFPFYNFHAASM